MSSIFSHTLPRAGCGSMPGPSLALDLQRRMSQHFCSSSQPAAGAEKMGLACLQQCRRATAGQRATFLTAAQLTRPAAEARGSRRPKMRSRMHLESSLISCKSRQKSAWRSGGQLLPRGRYGCWSGQRLGLDLSSACRAKRIACQALLGGPSLPLSALQAARGSWQMAVQDGVLTATVGATLKLFLVCGLIGWLLHSGRISDETAPVLSKVAFNVMIPCMLFTKVASTLANNLQPSLFAIPLVSMIQISIGGVGGRIVSMMVDPNVSRAPFGWHPLNPARSANAIALSTATAMGVPSAAPALMPRPDSPPKGTKELVEACCTFGNSLTLPLVFLSSLLPGAAFERAVGYTALFLVGWSPFLWAYGYRLLGNAGLPDCDEKQAGVLYTFDDEDMSTAQLALLAGTAAQGELTPAQKALQARLSLRRRLGNWRRAVEQVVNPPLLGIISGIAVGVSPLGTVLFNSTSAAAIALTTSLPMELKACLGVLKAGIEVLTLLAGGTLAVQSVVLAASLFQKSPAAEYRPAVATAVAAPLSKLQKQKEYAPRGGVEASIISPWKKEPDREQLKPVDWKASMSLAELSREDRPASSSPRRPPLRRPAQNLLQLLWPSSSLEWRMLLSVSLMRFVVVPWMSLALVGALTAWRILPADPVCFLTVLVQSAMPSAQNLALLLQLRKSTQPLAPRLATLLLRLYAVAVLPVTFWITVFVGRLPVPLAAM